MRQRNSTKGFTVVEILVTCMCFLLMLSALYAVYSIGMHYLRMAQVQSRLQQQATVAIQKVTRELSQSVDDPQTVKTGNAPPFVWFLSSEDMVDAAPFVSFHYDSGGKLEWKKWACFFLDPANHQLTRSELPLVGAPQTRPFGPITAPILANFQSASATYQRMVAQEIDSFQVDRTGPGVYQIQIVTALPGVDGKISKTRLATEVFLLNNY